MFADYRQLVEKRRMMLSVEGSVDPDQSYLGVIDPNADIVMQPEDYLSPDDLAAVNLHVLDCEYLPLFCPRPLARAHAFCLIGLLPGPGLAVQQGHTQLLETQAMEAGDARA